MFNKLGQNDDFRNGHIKKGRKYLDFNGFLKKAIEDLKAGKSIIGRDGVFALLPKRIIASAMEGWLDTHPLETPKTAPNRRKGQWPKNPQRPWGVGWMLCGQVLMWYLLYL